MLPREAEATDKPDNVTVLPVPTFALSKLAELAERITVSLVLAPLTSISLFATLALVSPS